MSTTNCEYNEISFSALALARTSSVLYTSLGGATFMGSAVLIFVASLLSLKLIRAKPT
jgi:hypothetical protein